MDNIKWFIEFVSQDSNHFIGFIIVLLVLAHLFNGFVTINYYYK
jgi:hypothetical protein